MLDESHSEKSCVLKLHLLGNRGEDVSFLSIVPSGAPAGPPDYGPVSGGSGGCHPGCGMMAHTVMATAAAQEK